MPAHTFSTLRRRLASAGFHREFVRQAILPDWWDASCEQDQEILVEIDIRVSRFLAQPLSVVQDPTVPLTPRAYSGAQLRRVRTNIDSDRLSSAIHAAMQIAGAVARCMPEDFPEFTGFPDNGLSWREEIERSSSTVTLQDIIRDLSSRGIPVIPVEVLPAPSFQGLACIIEERPIRVLGQKYDTPGHIAFITAHEVGHVSSGHCTEDNPVVDEEGSISDNSSMERAADRYATQVLVGEETVPVVGGDDFRQLAQNAFILEMERGVDAGMSIYAWAARTGNYPQATMAVRALYRGSGGRQLLRDFLRRNVDLDDASETDRALLRCVFGEEERDAGSY